jgi:hypothetical protein
MNKLSEMVSNIVESKLKIEGYSAEEENVI